MTSNYQTPTAETYAGLEKAFDHFNKALFGSRLSPVMFTLTRRRGAHGYFLAEQFSHRDGDKTHEIALNPQTMDREIGAVLSTLVHEMTHLEQEEYGTPGKNGHHNQEWVELMLRVGLTPDNFKGGMTGRKVSHTIDAGGAFELAMADLMPFDIPYFMQPREKVAAKKDNSKVKHTCPACDAKAWAKMGSRLICGDCNEYMEGEDA
jgi:predicted SprT family Zn-dependent metalloprotease